MVVALGPGKFYGSSLPRPRIYNDVKFNADRVDPPVPVTDSLLSWANEAHWSRGGLSFQRIRLQGRIEGNVNKLRKLREKAAKNSPKDQKCSISGAVKVNNGDDSESGGADSPPPAPKVVKRRRYMDLLDEESGGEEEVVEMKTKKKKPARRLVGEFEKVATETAAKGKAVSVEEEGVNEETCDCSGKKSKSEKKGKSEEENESNRRVNGVRTSPRLANRRSRKLDL